MRDATRLDRVERLIDAWEAWVHQPSSRAAAVAKEDALRALGLSGIHAHEAIAECRRRHVAGQPGGMSVPDACQTFVNETIPEAS
jgi:hypothetical protein